MCIALAQIRTTVGDVQANVDCIVAAASKARDEQQADLLVCPQLAVSGFPPHDLLLRRGMPAAVDRAMQRLADTIRGIVVVVGYPQYADGAIYNAAAVIGDGRIQKTYRKRQLSAAGAFDECRYFRAGEQSCSVELNGAQLGILIGDEIHAPRFGAPSRGAEVSAFLHLDAAPFTADEDRSAFVGRCAAARGVPILSANCVGGQDELVFAGDSVVMDAHGKPKLRLPAFAQRVCSVELVDGVVRSGEQAEPDSADARLYTALVRATADYVNDNGFAGVVLGLSGGIDSALALAIAVDALGPERVWAVSMPSRYTADISNSDAAAQATCQQVRYDALPIESLFAGYLDALTDVFAGREVDTTEENLQPRIRGTLLMALSNKFHHLVLAPGNKSEFAVGYSTLYGDMCGGYAPLKDVYKTRVYQLARYRNSIGPVIPERVIRRPPSAELRADQTDAQSLPDYDVLDAVIHAYVELGSSIAEICAMGFEAATVRRIAGLIRRAEYKRQQAPPGPKITGRDFGRGRIYPLTAVYGNI